jgi:glycosyltransferase involved in cell wall biosynthesis
LNICLLTETQSGCYKWRGAIPAKYLSQRGHRVQIFSDQARAYEAPDVLVLYRAHYPDAVKVVEWCRRNKIRVVFDTDDALDLVPAENMNYRAVQSRLPLYEVLLRSADAVTTTTEALASHLRRWNPNVTVIPNSIDPDEWTCATRSSEVRVGWTGSPTHFADLAIALDSIREVQRRYPFTFVLQGLCQESTLDELIAVLQARWGQALFQTPLGRSINHFMRKLRGIRYEYHPSVPIEQHPQKVCDLKFDIGIAPLLDDPFNRHKSCIKYYEYAMSGAVTLASHVVPYSTEVPITAKNNRESWKRRLEELLQADRTELWREQRDWVLTHRNIQKNVELWEQVFAGDLHNSYPLEAVSSLMEAH